MSKLDIKEILGSSTNLVSQLSKEQMIAIGNRVYTDYKMDLDARGNWSTRRTNWVKLFSLTRDTKNFPWDNCSNLCLPTMAISSVQFHARAFDALFGQKDVIRALWTDSAHKDAALRVQKHMNYQLTSNMVEWEADMDAMILQLAVMGCSFKKTYYDAILGRPVSTYIPPDDFIVPYGVTKLDNAKRLTHILHTDMSDLLKGQRDGIYVNIDEVRPSIIIDNDTTIKDANDISVGIDKPLDFDSKEVILLEQHRGLDLNGDGILEDYIVTIDLETRTVIRLESAIYTNQNGEDIKYNYFTDYQFIPNPGSIYGIGFGHLLEGLNESINSITNQVIDSGTLSNTTSGFINKRSGIQGGDMDMEIGKYKMVNFTGDDVRKAIYTFDFNPPSPVLFNTLSLLQDYASSISSVSDAMIGKLPPSDTTATTMLAVLEQGLKVFSTIQKRIHRSLKAEFSKIFTINSIYLDEQEYFQVQDSGSDEFKTMTVGRADYSLVKDVIPYSDPNIVSRAERLIKARQAWEFGLQNPLIANNPTSLYHLSREFFRALDLEDIDKIIQLPKEPEPVDMTPEEENSSFLKEVGTAPLPEQNHMAHMDSHLTFMESKWGDELTPQGRKLIESHIMETKSMMYMSEVQGGRQDTGGGMAIEPGNIMPSGYPQEATGGFEI